MEKNKNKKLEEANSILEQYIKQKKMRNTPERQAMLKAAYSIGTPFTVDLLTEYLGDVFIVSRATVYNNLELFYKAGIVIKRSIGGRGMEYEACINTQTHHNLVCTVCNQMFEFRDPTITQFFEQKKYKKFKMTNCSVLIYGICQTCQGRIKREQKKNSNQNKK